MTTKRGRFQRMVHFLVGLFGEKYFYCCTDAGCFTTVARTKRGAIREVEKRTGWKVKTLAEPYQ